MEVIYLIFFFVTRGAAFIDQVPQASIEQCEENGAALQKLYREIKFKCIPGLAQGGGRAHLSQPWNSCIAAASWIPPTGWT